MGSPTRRKLKEGVQQEILTNHYLNKYNNFMKNYNENQFSSEVPQQHRNSNTGRKHRKNFKEVMLQKKNNRNAVRNSREESESSPYRRNFKTELEEKNSREKTRRENQDNFYRLQNTLIKQLHQPTPSPLETNPFHQIEIVHRLSYDSRPERTQLFKIQNEESSDNIMICEDQKQAREYQDNVKLAQYELEVQKMRLHDISKGIRASFEKRTSRTNSKSKTNSPGPFHKYPPKPNESFPSSHEQSYFQQNVRSNFASIEQKRHSSVIKNPFLEQEQSLFQNHSKQPEIQKQYDRKSHRSKNQRQYRSVNRSISSKKSRKDSSQKNSIIGDRKKSSNNYEDSFHHNFPEIQQVPKLFDDTVRSREQDNNRSAASGSASSRGRQGEQNKQLSNHQLSMISRFSMTSTEGGVIIEHLERELNQNEFGPYQNALTSLLGLLGEYPNAWPIFVVGQRILEDRHQYDIKREIQDSEINRLQIGIQNLKRTPRKIKQTEKNSLKILSMVRELAGLLEQSN